MARRAQPPQGPLRRLGGPQGPRGGPSPGAIESYRATHWGVPATTYFYDPDPLLPGNITTMGQLHELVYDEGKDNSSAWSLRLPPGARLCYLPTGSTRLFNQMPARMKAGIRAEHWDAHPQAPTYRLDEVARHAGGRQQGGYPNVKVKVLGRVLEVYYRTLKGDGDQGRPEMFVHELGTEPDNDQLPWLAVDADGRLWWAGGGYWVEADGIRG